MATNHNEKKTEIKTIEWPYQRYPRKKNNLQPRRKNETCTDNCAPFKPTNKERTCNIDRKYNCDCLRDDVKRNLCHQPIAKPVVNRPTYQSSDNNSKYSSEKFHEFRMVKQNARKEFDALKSQRLKYQRNVEKRNVENAIKAHEEFLKQYKEYYVKNMEEKNYCELIQLLKQYQNVMANKETEQNKIENDCGGINTFFKSIGDVFYSWFRRNFTK